MLNIYEQVDANKRKSALIIGLFIAFIAGVAYALARAMGFDSLSFVGWALILSGIMSFASYYWSDQIILNLSGARPASRKKIFSLLHRHRESLLGGANPLPQTLRHRRYGHERFCHRPRPETRRGG